MLRSSNPPHLLGFPWNIPAFFRFGGDERIHNLLTGFIEQVGEAAQIFEGGDAICYDPDDSG